MLWMWESQASSARFPPKRRDEPANEQGLGADQNESAAARSAEPPAADYPAADTPAAGPVTTDSPAPPAGGPVQGGVAGPGPDTDGFRAGGAGVGVLLVVEPTVAACEVADLISLEPVTDNPGPSAQFVVKQAEEMERLISDIVSEMETEALFKLLPGPIAVC